MGHRDFSVLPNHSRQVTLAASTNPVHGVSFFENLGIQEKTPFGVFENLVTKKQLASLLVLSPSFISRLMSEEGLPYLKIGRAVRFRTKEVVEWLQKRRMP